MVAAAQVDGVHLAQEGEGLVDAEFSGARHEGPKILRQAAATETNACLEEFAPDPVVVADGLRQSGDVTAGRVAQLRHGVDEGDFRREEGVGGHLHQFGGGKVRHHQGDVLGQHGRVAGIEECLGVFSRCAVLGESVDDAVGMEGVGDGVALAQELRVPRQQHIFTAGLQPLGEPLRGADRNRRLAHHQRRSAGSGGKVLDDGVDGCVDLAEVRSQPARQLRGADPDEDQVGVGEASRVGGEIHSTGCDCPRQDLGETRLVERGLALRQLGNPVLVHVESHDVVADLRHAGRVHSPEIATTDHCNPHALKGSAWDPRGFPGSRGREERVIRVGTVTRGSGGRALSGRERPLRPSRGWRDRGRCGCPR